MSHSFFQNRKCEFFPCHAGAEAERFNCLFCFCPLYALAEACGGQFIRTPDGVKDCSACLFPHLPENYMAVCQKSTVLCERSKKRA